MTSYKIIGVLGGMSPESTREFYDLLIKKHYEQNKDYAYPEVIIYSLNFEKIIQLKKSDNSELYIEELMKGIFSLAKAGSEFIIIASNTPHVVFDELQKRSKIPLLSIVQNTVNKAKDIGLKKLLLLGTKFTMQSTFYKVEFQKTGIEIIVPSDDKQEIINKIIFDELVQGIVKQDSKKIILKVINSYEVNGVILGCTELPMIISSKDTSKVLLNTLVIHAESTLSYAKK